MQTESGVRYRQAENLFLNNKVAESHFGKLGGDAYVAFVDKQPLYRMYTNGNFTNLTSKMKGRII